MKTPVNITSIWNKFFDDYRTARFGARNPYDLTIAKTDFHVIYQGGRILKDIDHLRYCFDLFLQENNFVGDTAGLHLGSGFNGKILNDWLKYSHPLSEDIWVNYFGHESPHDGAWLDLIITSTPQRIRNNYKNQVFATALEHALSNPINNKQNSYRTSSIRQ